MTKEEALKWRPINSTHGDDPPHENGVVAIVLVPKVGYYLNGYWRDNETHEIITGSYWRKITIGEFHD